MADVRRSACNRDCPDACSLLVTVEDGRATALRGDPDDPVTQGFLCERTGRFLTRQYAADRLTTPLLRKGGELQPVSWDEAMSVAAEQLLAARAESGPASVLHYQSGGSLGVLMALPGLLFERFGPVTVKRGDICSGASEAAQQADFGISDSHDLFDLEHSRALVLWGKNPHVGNVHLLPVLKRLRAAGVPFTGIDPVRTRLASLCDRFVQPRPGADYALALGTARALYDQGWVDQAAAARCDGLEAHRALCHGHDVPDWAELAGVPADELLALARRLSQEGPCAILLGWGLGRRRNGFATVRAIDALTVLSGNLGLPGGGVSFYFNRRGAFDLEFRGGRELAPRSLSEARLGAEILEARDPPIRVAWINAANPVSMLPDSLVVQRALEQVPFVVVVDTHPTDTTDVADLVLPTLTLLEDSDVMGAYGHHWLRSSEAVIEPAGEARHELHILQDLAGRLGLGDVLAGSVEDWKARVTQRLAAAGAGVSAMRAGPVRNPFAPQVLFEDGRVETPNGRVQLSGDGPDAAPETDAEWPLTLMALSSRSMQSSQRSLPLEPGPALARVHPDVGAPFGDGGEALLESRSGRLPVRVLFDPLVRRDLVLMDKGGMLRDGCCTNALISARETDGGGGAAYYDELVRLVPGP
ncbi:MAG: molybdopterin-containing oxidoreductase catalytic subunit [Planctomycetota bacterium]|nr:MAG: molybdopterin-containing oxidoreductase catalytic subunit [Planctomycetota bacterium]